MDPTGHWTLVETLVATGLGGATVGGASGAVLGYRRTGSFQGAVKYGLYGAAGGALLGMAIGLASYTLAAFAPAQGGLARTAFSDLVAGQHSTNLKLFALGAGLGVTMTILAPESADRLGPEMVGASAIEGYGVILMGMLAKRRGSLPGWLVQGMRQELWRFRGRQINPRNLVRGLAYWAAYFAAGFASGHLVAKLSPSLGEALVNFVGDTGMFDQPD